MEMWERNKGRRWISSPWFGGWLMLGGARCCKWLAGSGQSAGHFSPAGPWVTERQSGKWGQAINSKGCAADKLPAVCPRMAPVFV